MKKSFSRAEPLYNFSRAHYGEDLSEIILNLTSGTGGDVV